MKFLFAKNCKLILINFAIVFILLTKTSYSQQSVFKVVSASDAEAIVSVVGYNYFSYDTIGSVKLDKNGVATLNHKYQGFALVTIGNSKQYPIILKGSSNSLNITSEEELPVFYNDNENNFLFRNLIAKDRLYRKTMSIDESLKGFMEDDPVYPILLSEKAKLDMMKNSYNKSLIDSSFYFAAKLLLAKELIETTYGIRTQDELKDRKSAFLEFIKSNLKILKHSDMLQQFGSQYVMMNEYVVTGQSNHYEQVINDVDKWVKYFGKEIGTKPIVEFFMNAYAGRSMLGMAGRISSAYSKEVACKVNLKKLNSKGKSFAEIDVKLSKRSSNTVKLKSIPSSYKILYFYKDNCPVALVQNIILSRYMSSKMYQIPVLTIFDANAENTVKLLGRLKPETFYYTEDKSLFKLAKIKKAPSYILLNKENKKEKKFNDLEKMKKYLEEKVMK